MLDDFERRIKDALEQGEARRNPFLSRALEHAIKLSLVIAVGDRPDTTVIEPAHMRWAIDMAWVSTCSMIGEAESKIADNDRQRVYNLIYDHIRKAGPEGGQPNRLRGRLSGAVWKSNWKEIVEELRETGRVQLRKTKPSGGVGPASGTLPVSSSTRTTIIEPVERWFRAAHSRLFVSASDRNFCGEFLPKPSGKNSEETRKELFKTSAGEFLPEYFPVFSGTFW